MSCKSESVRNCQREFQNAQVIVQEKSAQPDGLDASIAAIDLALMACKTAGRDDETKQLQSARNKLADHLQTVRERATRSKRAKLAPAEMDALVREGDPDCPRGMAYNLEGTSRTVKCTGLPPIRMNWKHVVDYYSKRGYRVTTADSPATVRAERGAELNVFTFSGRDDPSPAKCMTIYPEPNVTWQEAVARVTGAALPKLKLGSAVQIADGKLALHVDEGKDKLVITLGDCD